MQANDYAVAEQIKHPNSTISSFENDIALLRLDRKVKFIRPACLAEQFQPSTDAVATGWAQSNHQFARTLLKVELEVFTQEECNDVYDIDQNDGEDKITSTQICAGSRSQNGKGSCQVSVILNLGRKVPRFSKVIVALLTVATGPRGHPVSGVK